MTGYPTSRGRAGVISKLALTTLLLAGSGLAHGACPDRSNAQPARLAPADVQSISVEDLSPAWDSNEQYRLTWFGGYINKEGKLEQTCCFSSSVDASIGELRDVDARVHELRFLPAQVDGEAVDVYVSFTILGVKTDAGIRSTLLFNQLLSRDRFGIEYSAPQRIGQFPELSATEMSVEIESQVGADGTPDDSKVVQWETGSRQLRREITKHMDQSCFIPGMVNGEAQAMPYREVIDRRHQQLLLY